MYFNYWASCPNFELPDSAEDYVNEMIEFRNILDVFLLYAFLQTATYDQFPSIDTSFFKYQPPYFCKIWMVGAQCISPVE